MAEPRLPQRTVSRMAQPSASSADVESLFRKLIADFQALLDPRRMDALMQRLASRVQVAETEHAYRITVLHDHVAHPEDIAAEFSGSTVRLRRTAQSQTRTERDSVTAFSYYAEVFDHSISLEKSVRWRDRTISAHPGAWELTIPKV